MKSLKPIRPAQDRFEIQRTLNRMLDERFFPGFYDEDMLASPPLDMRETEDAIVIEMCIPGFKPEDVQIKVTGEVLSIRGEALDKDDHDEETYHLRERQFRSFKRTLQLPAKVLADKAEALFENGELKLTLPKAPEARAKTIEIKVK